MIPEKGKLYKLSIFSIKEENLIGLYLGNLGKQDFQLIPKYDDLFNFKKLEQKVAYTFLIGKETSWVFEDEILGEII